MDLLETSEPMRLTGNVAEKWKRFKQNFGLFLQPAAAAKDQPKTGASKEALLLSTAGDDALGVFYIFQFEANEDKNDYHTVVKNSDAYCAVVGNEVHERYVFHSRNQAEGEPFETFVRDLIKQAAQCSFGALQESMVKDQNVYVIYNPPLSGKMLRDNPLTLQKAEEMCRAAETVAQLREVLRRVHDSVDAVSRSSTPSKGAEKLKKNFTAVIANAGTNTNKAQTLERSVACVANRTISHLLVHQPQ